jgi:NAD(P)-dependent dehydrogenase (short-subunit alcohol dehydrogenase family)
MSVDNRVALVTGGTSGIGFATAQALARSGVRVFVASRKAPRNVGLNDANVQFVPCDVTRQDAVRSLVEEVQARAGRLDLAVNAAGYEGVMAPLHSYPIDDLRRVFDVNLMGTLFSMKYELEAMRAAGGGAIVNLASIAGLKGIPNAAAYTSSKHGVLGLTRAAALESADVPIRVNAVCPSLVDTAMADRLSDKVGMRKSDLAATNPMHRLASPAEVASAICWLLSDAASFVTGQAMGIDGGQSTA